MLTSQRKALILDILRRDGQVIAKRVAEDFELSEDTIRRDLREMAAEGLLKRVHGGALPITPELPDFTARRDVASDIKARLGARAAQMVKAGQMVFLDGGTTTAEIARHLPRDIAFTIATHSPTIAAELEHHPTAEVILTGGQALQTFDGGDRGSGGGGDLATAPRSLLPRRHGGPSGAWTFHRRFRGSGNQTAYRPLLGRNRMSC